MSPIRTPKPRQEPEPAGPGPTQPVYAGASDVGKVRTNNEDAFVTAPPLFAVADGMGGHKAGEVAAAGAIRALVAQASQNSDSLVAAVQAANQAVFQQATTNPDLQGMGTTITAMHVAGGAAKIVHVGDSRAYLLRGDKLRRLTRDHTVVERLAREGKIPASDVDHHPQRSVLERALGVAPEVDVDVRLIDVRPGDRLLLCTDGLSSMLSDEEIHHVLANEPTPDAATTKLLQGALQAGGKDNVTAVIVDFPEGYDPGPGTDPNETAEQPVVAEWDPDTTTHIPTGPMRPRRPPEAQPAAAAAAPAAQTFAGSRRVPPERSGTLPPPLPAGGTTTATPAQRPSQRPPADLPAEPAGAHSKKALKIGIIAAVVVVLLVAGIGVGVASARSSWYVGENGGKVSVFRGVPGSFAGIKLSWLQTTTDLATASLPEYAQDRVRQGITATNRQEADKTVANLRQQAAAPTPAPAQAPPPTATATAAPARTP